MYERRAFPKRCNCCGRIWDKAGWLTLHLRGVQEASNDPGDPDPIPDYEVRDCLCGSTLYVPLAPVAV